MAIGAGTAVMGGLSLAMGLGSSIAAAIHAARANRQAQIKRNINEQHAAEDTAWFNKDYYSDITKRSEIQNATRMLAENQKKADTAAAARQAVMGASPEQQLASQEVNRRTFADSLADIASQASNKRDQYLQNYQNRRDNYYKTRLGIEEDIANNERNIAGQWSNAAVNAFKGGAQLLGPALDGNGGAAPTTDSGDTTASSGVTNMTDEMLRMARTATGS